MLIRIMGTLLCMVGALTSRVAFGKVASSDYVDKIVSGLNADTIVRSDKNYNGNLSGTYNLQWGASLNVEDMSNINVNYGYINISGPDGSSKSSLNMNHDSVLNVNEDASIDVNSGASINVNAGVINVNSSDYGTGTVYINYGSRINMGAESMINLDRKAAINANSGSSINMKSGSTTTFKSGATVSVESGVTFTVPTPPVPSAH